MSDCNAPLAFDKLADWVEGELSAPDEEAVEEHLFTCPSCNRAAGELLAVVRGLRALLPPVITRTRFEALRAAGKRIRETPVRDGERVEVPFSPELDLLVHVLDTPALPDRVDLEVFAGGQRLRTVEAIPCDRERGHVYIACQRHFLDMFPRDLRFHVVAVRGAQREVVGDYGVNHL